MKLSFIIPTFQRPRILQKTLGCIAAQTILRSSPLRQGYEGQAGATDGKRSMLEVIVVSDGPDEKTAEMIMHTEWPFEIQYFAIPKSQQGVCRNRAAEKASGELVLLIGDDVFLDSRACEFHLQAHEKSQIPRPNGRSSGRANPKSQGIPKNQKPKTKNHVAVLGYTTWDPALKITPLMKWMEKSGLQFGYEKISDYARDFIPQEKQHWFTYTSHISLPNKMLYQNQFREDVSLYGWEDIEWGKRLADAGIKLFYEPDAKAFHHHEYTDEEVWERSRLLGESAILMEELVRLRRPNEASLQLVPRGWKRLAYHILALLPTYRGKHCKNFLRGMRSANL